MNRFILLKNYASMYVPSFEGVCACPSELAESLSDNGFFLHMLEPEISARDVIRPGRYLNTTERLNSLSKM